MLSAGRVPLICLIAAMLLGIAPATAQLTETAPAKPKPTPYAAVPVTLPAALDDPGFTSFRRELSAVAKSRVYSDLAKLVSPRGVFWDRDFGGNFDPKRAGADNFAAAIRLEEGMGAGWARLLALANETTAGAVAGRPGILCAPARPSFDEVEFDRLLDQTRGDTAEWHYPRKAGVPVRRAPNNGGRIVDQLGLNFVRVLGYDNANGATDRARNLWARVATPAGKIGYVPPDSLLPLQAERLCYAKDVTGLWRIAGYIGAGD